VGLADSLGQHPGRPALSHSLCGAPHPGWRFGVLIPYIATSFVASDRFQKADTDVLSEDISQLEAKIAAVRVELAALRQLLEERKPPCFG
jgi:uncharacterized protein YceH (UPF0502 family)